ncbi:MAG: hypothetical protein J5483_00355 [Lachnospiraceae bacterium]|nr:hypothetical protein [Lachnospiraceae bacterium]
MNWKYEKACVEAGMSEERIKELRKMFDADRKRLKRENRSMEDTGSYCVSLNLLVEKGGFEIPSSISVEETAIKNMYLEKLRECLKELDISDRDLVIAYFDTSVNFSQYARERGAKRADLIYRVECIVRQLRKKMQI